MRRHDHVTTTDQNTDTETLADVFERASYTHGCHLQIKVDGTIIATETPLNQTIVQILATGGSSERVPSVAC